ncbi:MAG: hypothetical protein WCY12_05840, partial [Candidatus Omnitrophota bacterium]
MSLLLSCPFSLFAAEVVIESDQAQFIKNFNEGLNIADGDSLKVIYTGTSADSSALFRDNSGNASYWGGSFWTNYGSFIFVNTHGINIGANANIQANNFIASTLNISDADFLSGNHKFFKDGENAFIINRGNIKIRNGGYAMLLSQAVQNLGNITVEASLGTIVLASGEEMTLALDDAADISVVIDKAVKDIVLGPDGKKMDSAIKNTGTLTANGGKVMLNAKILNKVFDYAINNTGVIQASAVESHNGVIELVAEGAPIVNSGILEAGKISVKAVGTEFINKGILIVEQTPGLVNSGIVEIKAAALVQDGLIDAGEEGSVSIEVDTVKTTLDSSAVDPVNAINLVIRANRVSITAKTFGSSTLPIGIDANNLILNRTEGDINILQSLGIGTSLLLRGPPEGFGSIIYNSDINLTLEAAAGAISIIPGVTLSANNLTLIAKNGISSRGALLVTNILTLTSSGPIVSLGVLNARILIERGASFVVGGIADVEYADVKNADGAIVYDTGSYSGVWSDAGDIIIEASAVITLTGDTTFWADNDGDGVGRFNMRSGSTIEGQGFNLIIRSSGVSEGTGLRANCNLRAINNVNTFTLGVSVTGFSPTFIANNDFVVTNLELNDVTFTAPSLLTISGNFTKNGGIFLHNDGVVLFNSSTQGNTIYSNGAVFYIVRFNNASGSWVLLDPLQVSRNVNVMAGTLDPNGFTVTGNGATNTLRVTGTILVDASTFADTYIGFETVILNSGSTVEYNSGSDQAIDSSLVYYNLVTSGAGTKTLDGDTAVTNLEVGAGTIFDPDGFKITGTYADIFGTVLVDAVSFSDNYSFSSGALETGSTVNYCGTTQVIASFVPYYNLVISGTGTKTLDGDTSIGGDLVVWLGNTLDTNGAIVAISGDLNNGGIITTSTGNIDITAAAISKSGIITNTGTLDTNDILLTTTTGDIEVDAIIASGLGDVALVSAGAITDADANSSVIADDLSLTAATGIGSSSNPINTTIATLTASTTTGNIYINETNDLGLNTISAPGTVSIIAGGAITDSNSGSNNITAADIILNAASGIGYYGLTGNALETMAASITANTTAGNIEIDNTNAADTTADATAGGSVL